MCWSPNMPITRRSITLSPGANLCAPRYHARSFHPGRLGGSRRFHAAAGAYTAAGTTEAIDQVVRRRDDGAGARWDGLTRFLDDGRIEIDSNVVERAIRPIAMPVSFCTPSSS